jgi:hypothetical protein
MSTIITRNSATSGSVPASLVQGELAINVTDGRLFYGSGSGNTVKEFTASGSGTTNTGSLLTTASFSNPNLTFTKGDGSTFNVDISSLTVTSASYAFTASYVNPLHQDVILTGSLLVTQSHISTVDYIDFTTLPTPPAFNTGRLHWTDDTKTLQLDTDVSGFELEIGHQSVIRGRNVNSFTLTKGTVVYINGESGNRPIFATASWEGDPSSATTIGIIAQDINSSQTGYAVTDGLIRGINTNAFSPGTSLYLSSSGQYTNTPPLSPLHEVRLGKTITQATNGVIYIDIQNGYELGELHDVLITSASNGDLISWNSGSNVWKNTKQLTGSYGLTGSLEATGSLGITGSLSVLQSLDSQNRYLIDNSNVNSIEWGGRLAKDSLNTPVIDWANQQLFQGSSGVLSANWSSHILYDTVATQSVDWNNRRLYKSDGSTFTVDWESQVLYDGIGNSSIDWSTRVLSDPSSGAFFWNAPSNLYVLGAYYPISTIFSQIENFAAQSGSYFGGGILQNLAGEVIPVAGLVDAGVSTGNLVYLNTDGVWYKTNQFSISSSYMLGICTSNESGKERVFIEGTIGFATSSIADMPYVSGSNFYGTPIYISGSNGAMSTQKPTSGVVRVVGHAFYNSTTTPTNWLMKFRPSNDWYEI